MAKRKFSKEEILQSAATDVTRVMFPRLEEADEEQFIKFFQMIASCLLEENGNLFLGIGPHVEKNGKTFTEDMEKVIEFIERNTQREYSFREGQLLIYITSEYCTGVWRES